MVISFMLKWARASARSFGLPKQDAFRRCLDSQLRELLCEKAKSRLFVSSETLMFVAKIQNMVSFLSPTLKKVSKIKSRKALLLRCFPARRHEKGATLLTRLKICTEKLP
jgi:hypothetical protein